MPLNPAKVALAVQGGLSVVCATCERYWEGRDKGLPGDRCTSLRPCGSPLAGDDFHAYKGPMTEFSLWCFVCGLDSVGAISKPGSKRRFGVCAVHKQMVPTMKPMAQDHTVPQQRASFHSASGQEVSIDSLIQPKKPSVWEVIQQTEAEFEKRDKERGLIPEDT